MAATDRIILFTWRPTSAVCVYVIRVLHSIFIIKIVMFWSISPMKGSSSPFTHSRTDCAPILWAQRLTSRQLRLEDILSYQNVRQFSLFHICFVKLIYFSLMTIKSCAHLFCSRASHFSPTHPCLKATSIKCLFFDSFR